MEKNLTHAPKASLPRDLLAGVVVFLVALPLCLGIALASGAPMVSGLIAGILGGIVVGFFSGSHTSVSGPAAGLTAVVASQIAALGSFEAFLLATTLAGAFQIVMGCLRAGFIAAFFPSSVIKGLLAAIGVILILKQIPHLFGHDPDVVGEMAFKQPDGQTTFSELFHTLFSIQPGAALVGLTSLLFLIAWDKIKILKKSPVPSALLVVVLGVVINQVLMSLSSAWTIGESHLVQVPVAGTLSEALGFLKSPDFTQWMNPAVYLAALIIALVASLETLLNLEAVDKLDPKQRYSPPNRELLAQGVGNMLSGLVGGLPMTSVIVRSSVNINAGGTSSLSAIFHGILLVGAVLLLPHWINLIPLSTLAAILIMTGYKLTSPAVIRKMWASGPRQFLPFLTTVVAIVLLDLMTGTFIGLAVSMGFILYTNYQRPLKKFMEHHVSGDILRIELSSQVSFFSRATLEKTLNEVPSGGNILIDARNTNFIDPDVLDFLQDYISKTAPARGIKVSFMGLKDRYDQLEDRIQYVDYSSREIQSTLSPQAVLDYLKQGNERFRSGQTLTRDFMRQVKATSMGQAPMAAILSCIDSRTPAEIIFDLGIGDIFSIRIAGNVAREKVLGSLEYACAVAKSKLIVVLGHTSCGAVQSSVDLYEKKQTAREATGCENLDLLVEEVQKSINERSSGKNLQEFVDEVAEKNVIRMVSLIRQKSPTLDRLCEEGAIAIVGGMYNVKDGSVNFLGGIDGDVGTSKTASSRANGSKLGLSAAS